MREWTEEQMEKAMQDVTNGALGVRRAALEYQVPCSTLSDRVTVEYTWFRYPNSSKSWMVGSLSSASPTLSFTCW